MYRVPWQAYDEWREYGIREGYTNRTHKSFKDTVDKKERSWYSKGGREGWFPTFLFKRKWRFIKFEKVPWKNFEEWKEYGINNGYDERTRSNLMKKGNKTERRWIVKGYGKHWVYNFPFKEGEINKVDNHTPWPTFETWTKFGIEQDYNQRNPQSLSKSDAKIENSWYSRGKRKKWTSKFPFCRIRLYRPYKLTPWQNFEEWKDYGIQQGYQQKNATSLTQNKNELEAKWYWKGVRNKWISKFEFFRLKKEAGYWHNLENILKELDNAIMKHIENNGKLPTTTDLGREGLNVAINRLYTYHNLTIRDAYHVLGYSQDSISLKLEQIFEKEAELAELYSSGIISVDILVEIISSLREFKKLPRSYLQAIIPKLNLGPVMYEPQEFENSGKNGKKDFEQIIEKAVKYLSELNGKADDLVERLYGEVLRVAQVDEGHAVDVLERLDRMIERRRNEDLI